MTHRVRIEIKQHIAYVTLTRPEQHNGVDVAMLRAMRRAQKSLGKQKQLRAVILQGEGPSFCAGLDFNSVLGKPSHALWAFLQLWWPVRNTFQDWSLGWRTLPMPVIAVLHGHCYGAGLQLALGADFRICNSATKLSFMEAKWGLVPDMGGAALVRELLPMDLAKELVLTGRIIDGQTAKNLGLVTQLSDTPLQAAEQLAAELATRSPDAIAAGKFLLQDAWQGSLRQALAAERRWQRRIVGRANQRIALERNQKKTDRAFKKCKF